MFTILMSVYHGERPEYFCRALSSVAGMSQIDAMDEMVMVVDGPISYSLHKVIEKWRGPLRIRTVILATNQGLDAALNAGLEVVKSPWVMRFDSDDVCLPNRINVQMPMMVSGQYDLIGGQIGEFVSDENHPHQVRRVPCDTAAIKSYAKRRNPMNHMTVCFRTEVVRELGGYPSSRFAQDYALWLLMIHAGARVANSDEVIVHARIGNGMYQRRGGLDYLRNEIALQEFFVSNGCKSIAEAVLDGLMRGLVFMLPVGLRAFVYRAFLRGGKG